MPLGSDQWTPAGHPMQAPVTAHPLGQGGRPPTGQFYTPPIGGDTWLNFTLSAADDWSNPVRVDFGSPITVLEVFAGASDPLVISWKDSTPSYTPGRYNLWHPGNGQIVEVVPSISTIWIATTTPGADPTDPVEVIGKGGVYGIQATALPGTLQGGAGGV